TLSWTGPALWRVFLEPGVSRRRGKILIFGGGGFCDRVGRLIPPGGPLETTAPRGPPQEDGESPVISPPCHGWQTPGVAIIFSGNFRLKRLRRTRDFSPPVGAVADWLLRPLGEFLPGGPTGTVWGCRAWGSRWLGGKPRRIKIKSMIGIRKR